MFVMSLDLVDTKKTRKTCAGKLKQYRRGFRWDI